MKYLFLFIAILSAAALASATESHHIVSKISDRYEPSKDGKMILKQSTYLVGYFAQDKEGLPKDVSTEAKTIEYGNAELESNMRRLDQVFMMADAMSGKKFKKSRKKVSEVICNSDGSAKNCSSSIEMSL